MAEERQVGTITHYYSKLGVGIVELSGALSAGDEIHVKGATTDFSQTVDSMEIERAAVTRAKAGDVIGIKAKEKVREGDGVYLVK